MKTTNCGFQYNNRTSLHRHRQHCIVCNSEVKLGAPSKTEGWIARCGERFSNERAKKLHHQTCLKCTKIKKQNIQKRQLNHNQSESQRLASSKAAKITSRRPEIQQQRAQVLAQWRLDNPEEFAKCIMAAQKSSKRESKPELWLKQHLGESWKTIQIRCLDKLKQVDLVKDNIWIEVDGFWHFFDTKRTKDLRPSRLKNTLSLRQYRDLILKDEAIRRGNVTLLRFSVECFYRTGEMKPEWIQYLTQILQSPKPGIWCHGKLYELCPWAKEGCSTLKLPPLNTTSSCPME
jgi:hypothetical protein